MNQRGLTLIEVTVASVLAFVVILAIGQVDVARVRMQQHVRGTGHSELLFATAHMVRFLQQADLINIIDNGNQDSVQFRTPIDPMVSFDDPTNYRWAEYKLAPGDELNFLDDVDQPPFPDCGVDERFFGIEALDMRFVNEAILPPPGGEPPVDDNNVLEIQMTSSSDSYTYTAEITIRASAYSNIANGLAPPGVSVLPAACP